MNNLLKGFLKGNAKRKKVWSLESSSSDAAFPLVSEKAEAQLRISKLQQQQTLFNHTPPPPQDQFPQLTSHKSSTFTFRPVLQHPPNSYLDSAETSRRRRERRLKNLPQLFLFTNSLKKSVIICPLVQHYCGKLTLPTVFFNCEDTLSH